MSIRHLIAVATLVAAIPAFTAAQKPAAKAGAQKPVASPADGVLASIDAKFDAYDRLQKQVWGFAEVGFQETASSAALRAALEQAGFTVKAGVADEPTAFLASYGSGKPIIGFMAEFDALPSLSQAAVPERKPLVAGGAGHGCGHNLLGVGAVAAGIAMKEWLASTGRPGTVRVYGTPAEEGGGGKVYQVRAGLFSDTDVVLDWHPDDGNSARPRTMLANISAKFRFKGVAATPRPIPSAAGRRWTRWRRWTAW